MQRLPALLVCISLLAPAPAARAFDWYGKVARDAELLDDPDPQTRVDALAQLASYDIEQTRSHLLEALRDPDPRVRVTAARILAHHRVKEAVPVVIDWLVDPDPKVKQDAARILGDLGDGSAVAPLVRSLGDQDPDVRHAVVVALGKIGSPSVVVPLLGRLEDDKANVKRAAIEQLSELGDERAVIPLVGAFNASSVEVKVAAVKAVGELGDDAAVPALIRLLRDPSEQVRLAAVAALGALRAAESIPLLVDELQRSRSREGRARVAFALGLIGGAGHRAAIDPLVAALADTKLRPAAREALTAIGDAAVDALIAHLDGRLDGHPATAVELLRDFGAARATATLVAELDRGRVNRELVLAALGASGDSQALVPVLSLLDAPDRSVRLHAIRALRPLLQPRAADVLLRVVDDEEPETRVLAVEYLGDLRARSALDKLVTLAGSEERLRLRRAAIESLGRIGDERAAQPLLALLSTAEPALRRSIADALVYIGSTSAVSGLVALSAAGTDAPRDVALHAARALAGLARTVEASGERRDLRAHFAALADAPGPGRVAAVRGFGALGSDDSGELLARLASSELTDLYRRRAAAIALGDSSDLRRDVLVDLLDETDDGLAAAAAWSLGKHPIGDDDSVTVEALVAAVRRRSWATPVNAAAALAHRARPADVEALLPLLHHKNRLVRLNIAYALGRLRAQRARGPLAIVLGRDPSPGVRVAAARALSRTGGATEALSEAANDPHPRVREAAERGQKKAFEPPGDVEWRTFFVVDPVDGDTPVADEPYFFAGADGIVRALYTDENGEAIEERFVIGDNADFLARAAADRY